MDNKNKQSLKDWTKPTMKVYSSEIIKSGTNSILANRDESADASYKADS